jgi:hypothetical protein
MTIGISFLNIMTGPGIEDKFLTMFIKRIFLLYLTQLSNTSSINVYNVYCYEMIYEDSRDLHKSQKFFCGPYIYSTLKKLT